MTAVDVVAVLAAWVAAFGWWWLYRREARRADEVEGMLCNLLDQVERVAASGGHLHTHRRCACGDVWLMDGAAAGDHARARCQPAREAL